MKAIRKDWRCMRAYGASRRMALRVCTRNLVRRIIKR